MLDDGIVQFGGAFILVTPARAENMRFAQSHFAKSPTIETDAYFSYCIPLQENYTPNTRPMWIQNMSRVGCIPSSIGKPPSPTPSMDLEKAPLT